VFHEMEGYIVFVVALAALLTLHRLLRVAANRFGGSADKKAAA
jgi:hypothetical protein